MTSVEQKYDDAVVLGDVRPDKDDFKAQAFQQRVGQKEAPTTEIREVERPATGPLGHVLDKVTGLQGKANVNAALAPMVHTQELMSHKAGLEHVTGLQAGKFGSVHSPGSIAEEVEEPSMVTFHNRPVAHSPPSLQKPEVVHRATSGDPLPSQLELPGAIGEAAGKGWDVIQERARSQVEKAKELYHIWKGEERRQSGDGDALPGMSAFHAQGIEPKEHDATTAGGFEGIKLKASQVFEEQIKPGVAKIEAKASELLHRGRTTDKESAGPTHRKAHSFRAPPRGKAETLRHRLVRYKNTVVDIWKGEEPLVRAKVRQGLKVLKDYRMDIPMLALATLLVLWASVSFVAWMAFPAKPLTEQVVMHDGAHKHDGHPIAHDNDYSVWNANFQNEVDYPTDDQKLAPLQDVPNARVIDRVKMSVDDLNRRLSDEIDDLKMRGTDRLHHLKDAMPTSFEDLKDTVKEKVADLKESVADNLNSLKQRARGSLGVGSEQNMDLYELNHQLGDDVEEEFEDIDAEEQEDPDAPPHSHTVPGWDSLKSQPTISHADIEEALQKDLHGGERGEGNVPPHKHTQPMQQQQQQQPQQQSQQQQGVHRDINGPQQQPRPTKQGVQQQEQQQQQQTSQLRDAMGPQDPRSRYVRPAMDMAGRQYQPAEHQGVNQGRVHDPVVVDQQARMNQQGVNMQQHGVHHDLGLNQPNVNQAGAPQPEGVRPAPGQIPVTHMHTDGSQVGTLQELEEQQLGLHRQRVDPNIQTQSGLPHTVDQSHIARQAQEAPNILTGQVPPQAQWQTQPKDRIGDLAGRQHGIHQDHLGQQNNANGRAARPQSAIPANQQAHTQQDILAPGQQPPVHHHHVHQHPAQRQQQSVPSQMNTQAVNNGGPIPQPHVHVHRHQHMYTLDANGQPIEGEPAPGQPHMHIMHEHVHVHQEPIVNGGRV